VLSRGKDSERVSMELQKGTHPSPFMVAIRHRRELIAEAATMMCRRLVRTKGVSRCDGATEDFRYLLVFFDNL
jgi:hypothetical protein